MLPPVLEIYVIWHPADQAGSTIAGEIIEHFHGSAFSGLIGGAVEVLVRSEAWLTLNGAPRPISTSTTVDGVKEPMFTAVVPILGIGMAAAVQNGGPWCDYLTSIVTSQKTVPSRIGIFPFRLHSAATDRSRLASIIDNIQTIASDPRDETIDPIANARCRDLSQALAQFVSGNTTDQLTVFLSHTKHGSDGEYGDVSALVQLVRDIIATTRMKEFFDARDLQPGGDWASALIQHAGKSALLALRTDLYPTREWCQREVLIAKRSGMPVVIADGLGYAEERGSFLMDHVPRTPIRADSKVWNRRDVFRALNILVDECLKRSLWSRQKELAHDRQDLLVSWWAPHAPEPLTFIQWLADSKAANTLPATEPLRILHPDPPLGPDEKAVLEQMLSLTGVNGKLDVMTPRQLASRGG